MSSENAPAACLPSENVPAGRRGDDGDARRCPAKRQKVSAACDECRGKKIKCDSARPACGPCERLGIACHWGIRRVRSAGASKQELQRLRLRVEELEHAAANHPAPQEQRQQQQQQRVPVGPLTSLTTHPPSVAAGEEGCSTDTPAMMGLVADGSTNPAAHPSHLHHQYSDFRQISFVNHLVTAMDGPSALIGPTAAAQDRRTSSLRASATRPRQDPPDYCLPNRSRADHLLATCWRLVHTLYPFLDVDDIESRYLSLWTGQDLGPDSTTFLCLLNIIFSLACHFDATTPAETRTANAARFYDRAQELLNLQSLRYPSILTVQCYLLLGQCLQSSNDPQLCWIVVGIAIRLAQSLGLDLDRSGARSAADRDDQVARCVWHGCVIMDKTLSTVFGRPSIITPHEATSVPLPAAHAKGSACNCFTTLPPPDEDQLSMHFFIESLKLFDLIGKPLNAQNRPSALFETTPDVISPWPAACINPQALSAVLDLDRAMWTWARGLPPCLRHSSDAVKSKVHQRQTNILFLRHQLFRILLYRPVVVRVCHASLGANSPGSLEDGLAFHITLQCAATCMRTALDVIGFFEKAVDSHDFAELDEVLSSWWYNIFYLYTAATVLVAGRLNPCIDNALPETAISEGLQSSLRLLDRFSSFSSHAATCARIVALLLEKAERQRLSPSAAKSNAQHAQDSTHADSWRQGPQDPASSRRNARTETASWEARTARERVNGTDRTTTGLAPDGTFESVGHDMAGSTFLPTNLGLEADAWRWDGEFNNLAWLTGFPSEVWQ